MKPTTTMVRPETASVQPQITVFAEIRTPLGNLIAEASDAGICRVDFVQDDVPSKQIMVPPLQSTRNADTHLSQLASELARYFQGEAVAFSVPLDTGGTAFQRAVWDHLLRIPYGTTTSYGALARLIGDAGSVRAVGRANALNPVAIVVPCHRVVGADGSLTGYAGGLWRKRRLLQLEATGSIDERQTKLFTTT